MKLPSEGEEVLKTRYLFLARKAVTVDEIMCSQCVTYVNKVLMFNRYIRTYMQHWVNIDSVPFL
jgi:hypothetical protein